MTGAATALLAIIALLLTQRPLSAGRSSRRARVPVRRGPRRAA